MAPMRPDHGRRANVWRRGFATARCRRAAVILILAVLAIAGAGDAAAYTANQVRFEFHPEGFYRVVVNYTVPELKEYRESYVEFLSRPEAEKFYWDLIKGADFHPPAAAARRFVNQPQTPEPW